MEKMCTALAWTSQPGSAVGRCQSSGGSSTSSDSTLANWMQEDREAEARAADPDGLSMTEREELRALRKEVIELRTDREILRKAAAYFARETTR